MMFNLFGKKRAPLALAATANGRVKPLSEVTDPVFASGIMGAGYGLTPPVIVSSHQFQVR